MGYPMARNLALKTNDAVSIHVFDVNATTVQQMQDENTQKIVSCKSSFEVAQNSVRTTDGSGLQGATSTHADYWYRISS